MIPTPAASTAIDRRAPQGHVPANSAGWSQPPGAPPSDGNGASFGRHLAAIRRYRWLVAGLALLGLGGGILLTRFIDPEYEVRSTIWISSETPIQEKNGPIRSSELLNTQAWVELLRSFRISDAVVMKMALYLAPDDAKDSTALAGFSLADRFRPGDYELRVDKGGRWTLAAETGAVVEQGAVGDSVGRQVGFRWAPPASELVAGRTIAFAVATPRETSIELTKRLAAELPEHSNFLWLSLTGKDSERTARTMNEWTREFVTVAAELKKRNLVEFANILGGQLRYAETSLRDAEMALESFRVNTITLPSEGATAVVPGVEMTRDPVLNAFFDQRVQYDNVRRDREALERLLAPGARDSVGPDALLAIPTVASTEAARPLRETIAQLYTKESELRMAQRLYTDEHQSVRLLHDEIATLRGITIPKLAGDVLRQMRLQEAELNGRIASASTELRAIPTRTIEEMRLRRQVAVAENLYTTLETRFSEAQLAAASAIPDVTVLDSAVAPVKPTTNTAPRVILTALLASLAAAIGLALLLDRLDRRVRYADQVTHGLGLSIVGAVPELRKRLSRGSEAEDHARTIEAFRTIRLNLQHSIGRPPYVLAISSPGAGDGKSLVSANLALSFAEAGFRTVLVDGDTRRGALHSTFGQPSRPGLVDALAGEASLEQAVRPTTHERLHLIPRGARRAQSPEMLGSETMTRVAETLRSHYDVVLFDTPPLGAGIDAYAIGTLAGHMLLVLRVGESDRGLAEAKLRLLDNLPIHLPGAVLNGADTGGEYEYYYSYMEGYAAVGGGGGGAETGTEVVVGRS